MPRTTNNYTEQMWAVIKKFAIQQNRLNAEKNFVVNEQRRLETEKPKSWKSQYTALGCKHDNAHVAMKQIDYSIDFVSRNMGFLPVDVYNEMESHWQKLLDKEKQGYQNF